QHERTQAGLLRRIGDRIKNIPVTCQGGGPITVGQRAGELVGPWHKIYVQSQGERGGKASAHAHSCIPRKIQSPGETISLAAGEQPAAQLSRARYRYRE